jgi:microcompartment protein CcmL/EutN
MKSLARLTAAFCGLLTLGSYAVAQTIPTSYSWTSTGPIISAKSDATHNIIAVKDPSAVLYNGRWVIYASTVNSAGSYGMEYLNVAEDWSDAATATPYFIDNGGTAPQVFYFTPQKKWYLIYQWTPQFSTNSDPTQPQNWTAPKNIGVSQPSGVNWLDFWVICDSTDCYLFFAADNGNFYRASTPIGNFPNGFSTPVVVASSTEFNMFEADNVYSVEGTGEYLANIECLGPSGQRYFRALWASSLGGTWSSLGNTDTFSTPFLGEDNVTFNSGVSAWTTSFSSGGLLIDGNDQTDSVNPNNLVFLYQGANPTAYANDSYGAIPWQLGLATSKANTTTSPSFTLSRSASTLSVTQGSSATDTVTVTPANGFTGSVTFTATGTPSGVTASFSPTSSTSSSVLTLSASSTATTGGPVTVTVTGTSGSTTASTTIALTVNTGTCTSTAITPYISVSGIWTAEASATVTSTSTVVNLGPQPTSGGSWAWTGPNGFTSTAREIDNIALSTGANVYTTTYTNSCGTKSTQVFNVTVSGSSPSFTLSPSASSLTVKQGTSGTDTITVADTGGFTGSVAFTVSGLPSGVTSSFSPTSSTSSSVLTLTASATATTGAFTITVTGTSGTTTATTTFTLSVTSGSSGGCAVTYTITPQNSSNFGASVAIKNNGTSTLSGWSLTWSFANGQTIASSWNGTVSQSGANVTVSEQSGQTWENIPAGGSYSGFGFNGTWNGTTNAKPAAFSLNGTACTVN